MHEMVSGLMTASQQRQHCWMTLPALAASRNELLPMTRYLHSLARVLLMQPHMHSIFVLIECTLVAVKK